jgi:hypothetical protein
VLLPNIVLDLVERILFRSKRDLMPIAPLIDVKGRQTGDIITILRIGPAIIVSNPELNRGLPTLILNVLDDLVLRRISYNATDIIGHSGCLAWRRLARSIFIPTRRYRDVLKLKKLHRRRRSAQISKGIVRLNLIQCMFVLLIEALLDMKIISMRPQNMPKNSDHLRTVHLLM